MVSPKAKTMLPYLTFDIQETHNGHTIKVLDKSNEFFFHGAMFYKTKSQIGDHWLSKFHLSLHQPQDDDDLDPLISLEIITKMSR